ncbi:MAG: hypothetical protein ACRDJE_22350, partial [Dehalococcoidia bacterium]
MVCTWGRHILRLTVAAVALLLLAAAVPGVAAQQPDGDGERLQELVARLLGSAGFTPDGRPITADILLGELPADSPVPLLVPPQGRVVGSVVRRAGSEVVGVTVALDVPATAEAIAAFYEQELPGRGFRPLPSGLSSQGGFQPTGQLTGRFFCGSAGGAFLSVTIVTRANGPSEVRLSSDTQTETPCSSPSAFGMGPSAPPLPVLTPPAGVVLRPGLGTPILVGGPPTPGSRVVSEALAMTDLSVTVLEAGFAE